MMWSSWKMEKKFKLHNSSAAVHHRTNRWLMWPFHNVVTSFLSQWKFVVLTSRWKKRWIQTKPTIMNIQIMENIILLKSDISAQKVFERDEGFTETIMTCGLSLSSAGFQQPSGNTVLSLSSGWHHHSDVHLFHGVLTNTPLSGSKRLKGVCLIYNSSEAGL